jgi:hypothetical protein
MFNKINKCLYKFYLLHSLDLNGVEPLCIQLFKGYIKKVTTLAHRPPSPGARAISHLFRTFSAFAECGHVSTELSNA